MVSQFDDVKTEHDKWFVLARQIKHINTACEYTHQFSQVLTTLDSPNGALKEMMGHMQCTPSYRRQMDNPLKIASALNKGNYYVHAMTL